MKLFFDTETTGKADFRSPCDARHQPRIVQLAALLTEDNGEEVQSINLIIGPDGFTIPIEASSIHGITTEIAEKCGVALIPALQTLHGMICAADTVIAHNSDFDVFVVNGETNRAEFESSIFGDVKIFCTMKALTPVMRIPGPYGFKWPRLQEAHKFAFGVEFDGAHDAMADVRACAKLFFWLQQQKGGAK